MTPMTVHKRSRAARALLILSVIGVVCFAASASAACPPLSRSLMRGMTGGDVTALQQFLIAQRLLSADAATGFFGPLTEQAVQSFQRSHGVVTSGTPATTGFGLVGMKTRTAIAASCSAGPSAAAASPAANCAPVDLPIGKPCSGTWKEVKSAQGCTASWECAR
ncbi:peptidoglycan-binding protein [Candidatus Parcubacteria bacterium]|nr:MAG: peptidoglycan-binding protein [Candidatus Parcubacteria bacterium]